MPRARREYSEDAKQHAVDLMINHQRTMVSIYREFGIPTRLLRVWRCEHNARSWADAVDVHFGFLEHHGFTMTEADASWFWTWTVVYRQQEAAVLITLNREYSCVDVELARARVDLPLAQSYLRADP